MPYPYELPARAFPDCTWRVRNLLKRHGFAHLLEADRMSDDDLVARGRVEYAGGPIGPKTLLEIRTAAQRYRADFFHSDWPVF